MIKFGDNLASLIKEGKIMLEYSNFEDLEKWKRRVQFLIEEIGTPIMIKEVEKEINSRPLWIAYPSQPKEEFEEQFISHKKESTHKIISLLEIIFEKQIKQGRISGIICLFVGAIFAILVYNFGWNLTGQILTAFSALFSLLGVGSLIKPASFGQMSTRILQNIGENSENMVNSPNSIQQQSGRDSKVVKIDQRGAKITHIHNS